MEDSLPLSPRQVPRGDAQVCSPDDLTPGMAIRIMHSDTGDTRDGRRIAEGVFQEYVTYEGERRIKFISSLRESWFTSDAGMEPYPNGLWNPANWVERQEP